VGFRTEFQDTGEDISRMAALSDGVFGVALTLLVLDLRVPETVPGVPLARAILLLWPKLFGYALTFAVVGAYWVAHHRMLRQITRYNRPLLWRNLLFLSLIALAPFPTSLVGRFGPSRADAQTAWIVYSINIALIGLSLFWLWRYAMTSGLADPRIEPRVARYLGDRTLIVPGVFLLSIGLAFVSPTLAPFSILLILPLSVLVRRTHARAAASVEEVE